MFENNNIVSNIEPTTLKTRREGVKKRGSENRGWKASDNGGYRGGVPLRDPTLEDTATRRVTRRHEDAKTPDEYLNALPPKKEGRGTKTLLIPGSAPSTPPRRREK